MAKKNNTKKTKKKSQKKDSSSKKHKEKKISDKVKSVIAKSDDGTVQLTFTIDKSKVKEELETTVKKLSETLEVKGFRKGKAPLEKVIESIDRNQLVQSTLNRIVPPILDHAFKEHELKPVMYPRVELLKAAEDSDWQLRATTAEIPDINLGDYKNMIRGETKSNEIWTPDKAKGDKPGEGKDEKATQAQKEQELMKLLLENIKVKVPKVLVEEEVNARLAKLLDQIDKLGLDLESYLKSVGKDSEKLKEEYHSQAQETLKLELILNKIAESENVTVTDAEIEPYLKQLESTKDITEESKAQQITYIKTTLRKRKTLENLLNLIPSQ